MQITFRPYVDNVTLIRPQIDSRYIFGIYYTPYMEYLTCMAAPPTEISAILSCPISFDHVTCCSSLKFFVREVQRGIVKVWCKTVILGTGETTPFSLKVN